MLGRLGGPAYLAKGLLARLPARSADPEGGRPWLANPGGGRPRPADPGVGGSAQWVSVGKGLPCDIDMDLLHDSSEPEVGYIKGIEKPLSHADRFGGLFFLVQYDI